MKCKIALCSSLFSFFLKIMMSSNAFTDFLPDFSLKSASSTPTQISSQFSAFLDKYSGFSSFIGMGLVTLEQKKTLLASLVHSLRKESASLSWTPQRKRNYLPFKIRQEKSLKCTFLCSLPCFLFGCDDCKKYFFRHCK